MSNFGMVLHFCRTQPYSRCTAEADDLDDSPDIDLGRSHAHTEKVRKAFKGDLKEMWDGYGIIRDVVVSTGYMLFKPLLTRI